MDPGTATLAAGGIGAATSIAGGLMSSNFLKGSSKRDRRFQREVMQNAVQWRVNDAKAAGIHPLFALGAQVGTSGGSPTFVGDPLGPSLAEAGQNISNAVARAGSRLSPEETQQHQMQMALLNSQIDKNAAEAAAIRSQIALNTQGGQFPTGIQLENMGGSSPNIVDKTAGVINVKPPDQLSAKIGMPESIAGTHPWFMKYRLGPNLEAYLPGNTQEHAQELLSEMSMIEKFGLAMQNAHYFKNDPHYLSKALGWMLAGQDPSDPYTMSGAHAAVKRAVKDYPAESSRRRNESFQEIGKWWDRKLGAAKNWMKERGWQEGR